MNLGMLYVEVGRLDEGTALMEQALARAAESGDYQMESLSHSMLADAYRRLGRHDEAVRRAQEALAISRRVRVGYQEAAALAVLGQVMAESGNPAQARSCLVRSRFPAGQPRQWHELPTSQARTYPQAPFPSRRSP